MFIRVGFRISIDERVLLVIEFKPLKCNRKSKIGRLFQKPKNHLSEILRKRLLKMTRLKYNIFSLNFFAKDKLIV